MRLYVLRNADGGIYLMKISAGAEEMLTVNTWEAPAYMSCKHHLQLDGERRCNDCLQHPAKPPTTTTLSSPFLSYNTTPTPLLPLRSTCICQAEKSCSIYPAATKRCRVLRIQYVALHAPTCWFNLKIFSASRWGCHCTSIILFEVRLFLCISPFCLKIFFPTSASLTH